MPENIISRFRTTGVCPLDSEAIKIEDWSTSDGETGVLGPELKSADSSCDNPIKEAGPVVFGEAHIELFEHRYENGCNVSSTRSHPQDLPSINRVSSLDNSVTHPTADLE